jgi:hypothetical protein
MSMKFDNSQFLLAMKQLTAETGVELQTVMRWQMGLWIRDIMKKMYGDPKAWGPTDNKGLLQEKMGAAAIYGDLLGTRKRGETLFAAYDPALAKPSERPLYHATLLTAESGATYMVDNAHFLPSASTAQLSAIHQAHRDKRGRVRVPGLPYRKEGKTKISMVYTVPKDALAAYVKHVQASVGKAKASWSRAYDYFKRNVGMNLLPWTPPSWIGRHAKSMWGESVVGDQFEAATMTGSFWAGSNVVHGQDPQDALERTWPTRRKDLEGHMALKRLKGRIEKFSAKEARAA